LYAKSKSNLDLKKRFLRGQPTTKKANNKKRQGQQKAVACGGEGGGLAPPRHRTAFGLPFFVGFRGVRNSQTKRVHLHPFKRS